MQRLLQDYLKTKGGGDKMPKRKEKNVIVSPFKHIMISGQKRASVGFDTRKEAVAFIKRRRLKKAILLIKKGRRR